MREHFEKAYKGFCNILKILGEDAQKIAEIAKVACVYITLPIWIIPYSIIRKMKKGEIENA